MAKRAVVSSEVFDDEPSVDPDVERDPDDVVTRILDAAAEQFTRYGVRRSSIDEVARRARVGRNTVFRRVGTKDELVRAVLDRELQRMIAELDRIATSPGGSVDRVARIFTAVVQTYRTHPLRPGEHDPSATAELSAFGDGEFLQLAAAYAAGLLTADQERGQLPADLDVDTLSEVLIRLLHSVLLVPHLSRPLESEAELRAFAAAVLRPYVS